VAAPSLVAGTVLGLLGVGVIAAIALSVVAWRRRDTPGSRSFILFLMSAAVYAGASFAVMITPGADLALLFYHVATVGGVAIGITWLLFVIEYAGYWESLAWWSHLAIWGLPGVYALTVLTNPMHGLVFSTTVTSYESLTLVSPTFEPLGRVAIVYILGLTLVSYAILTHLFLRTRNVHRKQTGAILFGALIPMVAYAVFLGGIGPHPALDLTPVAFSLEAVVVGWALFRYDFLAVSPIATELYLQRMADPLLVLDERDRLVDYNESAAAVLGLENPGTRPHIRSISSTLAGALDGDGGAVELSTPDGPARFDLTETSIHDQHDRLRGSMVVLRDVTELEEQRAELQRKNAQLEQFTSVVSHDLRNPLNVAKGFAELARDEDDPAALERSIDAMDDMEALIDDLLTLAREGQSVGELELVSFRDVVDAAWEEAPTGDAVLAVDDDADFECYADPDRFRELLGNLFRNSVEHGTPDPASDSPVASDDGSSEDASNAAPDASDETSPEGDGDVAGGPRLTVTVGKLDDRSGFYVEDDGVGIPDAHADSVFESGFSTSSGGTGLGLSIVSTIANGHGWGVSLGESEAGGVRLEFDGVRMASAR